MKKILFYSFLTLVFMNCTPAKKTIDKGTTMTETSKQVTSSLNDDINGRWTLKNYSAFMSITEDHKFPKYEDGDVVWEFNGKDGYGEVTITKKNPDEENDYSSKPNKINFWTGECIINVGNMLYLYSVNGDELILDSNYDPSLGPDAAVMTFKRMK